MSSHQLTKAVGDSTRNLSLFEQHNVIDVVPPNINNSNNRVQLFVFDENDAVKRCSRKAEVPICVMFQGRTVLS